MDPSGTIHGIIYNWVIYKYDKIIGTFRRRKNQRMTQVKMFIHFRLTQHVSGIIMPIVRRQTE